MAISDINNRNFQSPLTYEFRVDKLLDFNFFVQKVNLPNLTLPSVEKSTPFSIIPYAGDHLTFGELSVDFKVSEGMYNWYEIFSWMRSLGFPESQKQYGDLRRGQNKDLNGKTMTPLIIPKAHGAIYSQGYLLVNTSQNNPAIRITFIDLYPVSLSEIVFNSTEQDVNFVTATVGFKYDYFTVEKLL